MPDPDYGLVLITKGKFAGRIGDYDDEADEFRGAVYFGGLFRAREYYLVDKRHFKEPTVNDLFNRYTAISEEIFDILKSEASPTLSEYRYLCSIMAESHQIYTELEWRNLVGRYGRTRKGKTIYLAHSTKDKGRVRMLHDDLKSLGHNPWLDEVQISVGESIIRKLEEGIEQCEYMIVFLSKNAENSEWVRAEWETKFKAEIRRQQISVLPALLEKCSIPPMLDRLKYADFRESYNEGLEQILFAIGHKQKRTAVGTSTLRKNRTLPSS
jgi:TIR domain